MERSVKTVEISIPSKDSPAKMTLGRYFYPPPPPREPLDGDRPSVRSGYCYPRQWDIRTNELSDSWLQMIEQDIANQLTVEVKKHPFTGRYGFTGVKVKVDFVCDHNRYLSSENQTKLDALNKKLGDAQRERDAFICELIAHECSVCHVKNEEVDQVEVRLPSGGLTYEWFCDACDKKREIPVRDPSEDFLLCEVCNKRTVDVHATFTNEDAGSLKFLCNACDKSATK